VIATTLDVGVRTVERLRQRAVTEGVELDAGLAGLGKTALEVLRQGMNGPDPRIQSQNARWVLEQLRGKATPRREEEADDTGDSVAQMRELLRTPITVHYPDPSGPDGWQPQGMRPLTG